MSVRALALVCGLASSAALAQANSWAIDRVAGTAVMDEVSPLSFRVTNATGSRDNIDSFSIGIPPGPYDVEGATAPTGWRTSLIDRQNRTITFTALNSCTASTNALRPGQSAVFEVRVIGTAQAADAPNQNVQNNRTTVLDPCNRNVKFNTRTGNSSWTLVGLGARLTPNLRALAVNEQLTLTLTITNNSTAVQNAIAPVAPTIAGAGFALVSGPTPAAVSNLAIDGVASFVWVYRATSGGAGTFTTRATNGTVSSANVTSAPVLVGSFPAAVIVTPSTTVSNGVVTVQVLPTNNDVAAMTNVVSPAPQVVVTGGATATMLSGPTPTLVDALAARSTTAFTTTWRISGAPGDRVTFTAQASGTLSNGTVVSAAPVGSAVVSVQELTIRPNPVAVFAGSGATRIAYTIANSSAQAVTNVVMQYPDQTLFRTPTAVSIPAGWTVTNSVKPRGLLFTANATSRIQPGQSQTFTINFASIGAATAITPTTHKALVTFADTTTARVEGTVTVAINRAIPDVIIPVAVATNGRAHFTWSNPSLHDGVLILRSTGTPPNAPPVLGNRYPAGTSLGNATVVYEDSLSFNGSFADTGLTNGTRYYYRFFNRDEYGIYSPGSVPTASPGNQLLVIPPWGTGTDPLWCSTVGLPALQQPFTDLGKTVFQSSNGSFFTANTITTGAPVNGNEKWRPSLTRGVVQARPTAQRLGGAAEPSLFVGDQLGFAYRIDGATGAITWTANGGVALGEVIQAQSVVVPRQFTNAAYQAVYANDVALFGTRNSTARSSNSLWGLRADTGARLFQYQPGDLDQITGAPLFDFSGNTIWLASLRGAGPSLRVLNALAPTGTPLLVVSDLGDIPTGVTRNGNTNQALVVDRGGTVRGYSIASRAMVWTTNAGGTVTQPLVTYLEDFFVSTQTGVQRYHVDATTQAVTAVWAAPAAMRLPSSVRVDAAAGKVFVGDGDGFLRRLDLATGALERAVQVSTTGGVSMPSLDTTTGLKRVYVGTADGRLCAFPSTF